MEKSFCPYCGQPLSVGCDCARQVAEEAELLQEEYESRPEVQDGWHQQDIIDMYRRER